MNRIASRRFVQIGLVLGLVSLSTLAEERRPLSERLEGLLQDRREARSQQREQRERARVRTARPSPPPRTVTPPGSYSLSIDGDFELGGFVFKEGHPFLHNDGGVAGANTALGIDALISTTTGSSNTALGASAMQFNATGQRNTASGVYALYSDTEGEDNTAIGAFALHSSDDTENNTAVGAYALFSNTQGEENTASGAFALFSNIGGGRNTAIGAYALHSNTDADNNTAIGYYALYSNTGGEENTAIGRDALSDNTTGGENTAIGAFAMQTNTTGSYNTAIGYQALNLGTTGSRNTAIGYSTLLLADTGSRNIALGYGAGYLNEHGSNNIWIANYGAEESNTLRIGKGTGTGYSEQNRAFISGIRGITTGEPGALAVVIDSEGQLGTVSSSRRVKEEIRDMGGASSELSELRPVTFRYRKAYEDGSKPLRYGLIAEEVAEVFPELVAYDAEGRPESVLYHLLPPMLLNELQAAQGAIAAQRRRIETQEDELRRLRALAGELTGLRARLERLEAARLADLGQEKASTGRASTKGRTR